jgi:hypothetical protein
MTAGYCLSGVVPNSHGCNWVFAPSCWHLRVVNAAVQLALPLTPRAVCQTAGSMLFSCMYLLCFCCLTQTACVPIKLCMCSGSIVACVKLTVPAIPPRCKKLAIGSDS